MTEEAAAETSLPAEDLSTSAVQDDVQRLDAALRELIGRVEHVRAILEAGPAAADVQELIALLDTTDARSALCLNLAEPPLRRAAEARAKEKLR
jgi:hypothetical protein